MPSYLVLVNGQPYIREALPAAVVTTETGGKALVLVQEQAAKFNPHHDRLGRFAHGEGGGSATAVRETLPEVGQFANLGQAQSWARETYPAVQWDFEGADIDTINPMLSKVHEVLQQYPDALNGINYFGTFQGSRAPELGEPFGNVYAFFDREYGQIGINPYFYGNPTRLRVRLQVDTEQGWSPQGSNHPAYPVIHELGHAVYWRHESVPAVQSFMAETKATKSLAKYALKSKTEAWAEGFAQAHLADTKSWNKYTRAQVSVLKTLAMAERGE